jgi:hypothetical protein
MKDGLFTSQFPALDVQAPGDQGHPEELAPEASLLQGVHTGGKSCYAVQADWSRAGHSPRMRLGSKESSRQ